MLVVVDQTGTRGGSVKITAVSMVALLLFLGALGCSQEKPAGPTTTDLNRERAALAAKVKTQKVKKKPQRKAVVEAAEPEMPSFAAVDMDFNYDSQGARDPFRSFKWEQLALALEQAETRGPLEQFDLSQLSLVAVVWKTGSAKALVQDPSGQSYIVGRGARLGKNEGHVTDIDDNLVVVKETYVDFLGQETTKDIEMRIRRSQGG